MIDSQFARWYAEQALYGTLFTWAVTALGAGVVFIEPLLPGGAASHQLFLDIMLGFAGGVMIAASYWSLLAPAISMAEQDWYGSTTFAQLDLPNGIQKTVTYAFLPAAVGFAAGGLFLIVGDCVRFAPRTHVAKLIGCPTSRVVARL